LIDVYKQGRVESWRRAETTRAPRTREEIPMSRTQDTVPPPELIEALQQVRQLAAELGGQGPLRWVSRFLGEDLSKLTTEECKIRGFVLQMFPLGEPAEVAVGAIPILGRPELKKVQDELRDGLQAFVEGDGWGWGPPVQRITLIRPRDGTGPVTRSWMIEAGGRLRILWAVGEHVRRYGQRLRICQDSHCRTPFLAHKRQKYCTPKCSQRVREVRRQKKMSQPKRRRTNQRKGVR